MREKKDGMLVYKFFLFLVYLHFSFSLLFQFIRSAKQSVIVGPESQVIIECVGKNDHHCLSYVLPFVAQIIILIKQ